MRPPRSRFARLVRRLALALALLLIAAAAGIAWWWLPVEDEVDLRVAWPATVDTLAGDGVAEVRDAASTRARFADPFGVAVTHGGTVFVADGAGGDRIRAISPDGETITVAGGPPGYADGPGAMARFRTPSGVALDAQGVLYIADTGNNRVRRMSPDGHVSTLAGDGEAGFRDGAALAARFNAPLAVALDATGRVVVADTYNDRLRVIDPNGDVRTLAGAGTPGFLDGVGDQAQFDTPSGVAVTADGTIYVADTGNHVVRVVAPSGLVSTLAASVAAALQRPIGLTVDDAGRVYVTDDSARLVELREDGGWRVVAGDTPGYADGRGGEARFRRPAGVAADGLGRLIVADAGNALVRVVAAPSRRARLTPASPWIAPRFDVERFALTPLLWPLAPLWEPFEIAGTMGEARGGEADRFHAGIDVRAEAGTPVLAVRDGIVHAPIATGAFDTLNEWIRIGAITYVHLRAGRDERRTPLNDARFAPTYDASGTLIGMRVKRGAHFGTGDTVGSVNRFNHVHVNVGWSGDEHNPLQFRLPQLRDTVPPTIVRVTLLGADGTPLRRREQGRLVVSGEVQIVVDAYDQMDDNRPSRRLGLYALGYQVLTADGGQVSGFERRRETIRFDRLASDATAPSLVYAPGSGIPFYGGRRTQFLYLVTNTLRDGVAAPGRWDASTLTPGDYVLRIYAVDAAGNEAVRNRDLTIRVE